MSRFVGGPFDGREIRTRYDHLPVLVLPHPWSRFVEPATCEHYELRRGVRVHVQSRPYPKPTPPTSEGEK